MYYHGPATMITIVDDYLISESSVGDYELSTATHTALKIKLTDLKHEREPNSFAGFALARSPETGAITISMGQKIREAVRTHFPSLLTSEAAAPTTPLSEPHSKSMTAIIDDMKLAALVPHAKTGRPVLDAAQKAVQRGIGGMQFPLRICPAISLPMHRLSCVMARPPVPEAQLALHDMYKYMHAHADDGITYGGGGLATRDPLTACINASFRMDSGAPANLEATADATFDLFEILGILLTKGGGSIHHSTHNVGAVVTCSMQAESYANTRAGDLTMYARNIERGFGTPVDEPTLVGTDSLSHQQVVNRHAGAGRSKPFIKQYVIMTQRIASNDLTVGHIADEHMPSDFLTKWVSKRKLLKSIAYATNSAAFVPMPPIEPMASIAE